jgi:hypothetical protein
MIRTTLQYLKDLLQRHPLLAGLAVAVAFTLLLNQHSLFATATLLSVLPCLLIVWLCMKSMDGESACKQEAPEQSSLTQNMNKPTAVDQESRHA